jgi:hypothetical protein
MREDKKTKKRKQCFGNNKFCKVFVGKCIHFQSACSQGDDAGTIVLCL